MKTLALILLGLVTSIAAQGDSPKVGNITISILWDGDPPPKKPFTLSKDFVERRPEEAAFCGRCAEESKLAVEDLLVDAKSKGIRNVAASVLGVTGVVESMPALVLDNANCRFEPHVGFAPVGKPITIKNSDTFAHNARILVRGTQEFYNGLIASGKTAETKNVLVSGTYLVVCDVHPWMRAHVIATKHPYVGVSSAEGILRIAQVPAGPNREIICWHETLGEARIKVDVKSNETTEKTLTQKDFKAR